jgi:histidine triad (HIT) family protein
MTDCVFCRIIKGESPARLEFQDQTMTAFHDIHPAGPIHILVVPNEHIPSLNDLQPENEALLGRMFSVARDLAHKHHIDRSGYRLIINTGPDANQTVFHLHLHLIGGKPMRFPMG